MGSKFVTSNKMIPRSWNFTQIHNFAWGIWLSNLFLSNHIFWPILGHPKGQYWGQKGQKLSIPLNMIPGSWNLQRDIIHNHRFYTATHLGQIISFVPFLAHPSGQKGSKIVHFSKSNPRSSKYAQRNNFSPELS